MATAYRSSQTVTNASAGTSVTVSKPSGIVDTGTNSGRDILIAFIAATGAPTFTAPANWTLITTAVDAGNNVTLKAYWKLASSEGASWTWTLGTSQRNWGWVGAYTGVDPTSPTYSAGFASETDITPTTSTVLNLGANNLQGGTVVAAAAATRTASGSATTWALTSSSTVLTERSDQSTNAGAGTDISGVVGDYASPVAYTSFVSSVVTASQNQTAGAAMMFGLRPYFVPYGGKVKDAGIVLEAAFGVDPDSDSSAWSWTNLTAYVHQPAKITLDHGRANRSSVADPSRMVFTLLNRSGEFTSPAGAYTSDMVLNLPIRVRFNGFGTTVGGQGYHRGTMFLASMRPRWDESLKFSVVDVVAQGRLRRLQQRDDVLKSAAYTAIQRMASNSGNVSPLVHWPFEDESNATKAASAVAGVDALSVTDVEFAADSSILGAAPLARLTATTVINGPVPVYTDTGTWTAMWCMTIPSEPASETVLMDIVTSSSGANRYRLTLLPGAPSQLVVKIFSPASVELFNSGTTVTESLFYGAGHFYTFTATQNGADIDFSATWYGLVSGGKSGTVTTQTLGVAQNLLVALGFGADDYGFGHLALHTAPGADGSFSGTAVAEANAGDWPWARFQRLCTEQSIPYTMDQSDNQDLEMGPQTVASFISLVRETELVEGCVVTDSGESAGEVGLLWFPAREDRENINASMTLDASVGQVAPGFTPVLDDQDVVNDFEASRSDGSSVRVTDETSIATIGRYRQGTTFNVNDDSFLVHLAGWRVNLGTVPGMRFPTVSWNLRRSPELAEEWMACRLFHRIDITDPPSQYPPDDIQAILEGYTETISSDEWTVQANLSPFRPNEVLVLAQTAGDTSTFLGRLDSEADATIRTALNSGTTTISIDPNGRWWTTVADDLTPRLQARLGGEVVEASAATNQFATFVAAGTAAHASNASVTPTLPAGATTGDLLLIWCAIRNSGAGVPVAPSGYTRLPVFDATDNCQLFAKVHSGSESNPTVTFTGGVANATTSAQMAAFRGTPTTLPDLADIVVKSATQLNASAQNIAYPALPEVEAQSSLLLWLGWKQDDWTSVATLGGTNEIGEPASTTGDDQGLVWDYLNVAADIDIGSGSFTVTGGASAISRGAVVALVAGHQDLTVTRSVNGVVKSHAAGETIEVEQAYVLGM